MRQLTPEQVQRFWALVDRGAPHECWPWMGRRNVYRGGYGVWTVVIGSEPHHLLAHRVAYALSNGPIREGMWALHHCDRPACVNPRHLFLGTHDDNMRDMRRKGRGATGTRHGSAKLDDAAVRAIREACASGESQRSVGRRFGVSQSTVSYAVAGKTWRHA